MSLSIGIVGLPNVGKSTLFKALTKNPIDIANYPFCTIAPNVGVVEVPDDRLQQLAVVSKSEKIIPTVIEFVDIAGLVKGASEGEGLGNEFLANIREVDAIAHVVRQFSDPDVVHVDGKVDPVSDIETINTELILKDLETITRRAADLKSKTKSGADKEALTRLAAVEKVKVGLAAGTLAARLDLTHDEKVLIQDLHLLTAKPVITVVNVDESEIGVRPAQGGSAIGGKLAIEGVRADDMVVISAKIEAELADLSDSDRQEYLTELGMSASGLDRLITKGYEVLNLITFFTSGQQETRAWTVTRGSLAPQAAGKIHTDFEQGFIRAEVIKWQDCVQYGELGCKEKGLLRTEGKEYIVQDGDVMHFRFSP
ncbi:redox-regulated ATPase YchF [Candidatus Falkowbacteria bacterium]|nr:redox-regulated ATPase YchF [Candidatus Falkowbacteria bacterium]